MPQSVPPITEEKFYGIHTFGNPLSRIPGSASLLTDFRVMPDFYLRLRSGRKARMFNAEGTAIRKIHVYRAPENAGNETHFIQRVLAGVVKWESLALSTWVVDPAFSITIDQTNGGAFTATAAAPSTNLRNRVALYNGLGIRDGNNSRPPFSSGLQRYFGLDAYCPNGNPVATFSPGGGTNSIVSAAIQIWVGLHNASTGHFSNGVYAGRLEPFDGPGVVTVSDLHKLSYAAMWSGEQTELYYVFYATSEGGSIPRPILNAELTEVYKVPVTESSASLSIYPLFAGWVTDLTNEMPTDNHPPKPMRSIAYVNGRIYGVLTTGGSGSAVLQRKIDDRYYMDFTYQPADNYRAGIVYSKSAASATKPSLLGVPEESWPLVNFTPTPNSEVPLKLAPAPTIDERPERLLALTATKSFIVTEAADGIHEWTTISAVNGIAREECYVETQWGSVWLTQRNQVARYSLDYPQVAVISELYDSVVRGKIPLFCSYVLDPVNLVDQVRFYFSDGTCLVHDFAVRTPQFVHGQGYVLTNQNYTSGGTVTGSDKKVYHLLASRHIYTTEGQPEDGKVVTFDEDFGASSATLVRSNFSGKWRGQHQDFGDDSISKTVNHIDIEGDDRFNLVWYPDRTAVSQASAHTTLPRGPVPDSRNPDMPSWRVKLEKGNGRWHKFEITLTGDHMLAATYPSRDEEETLARPMYGMIARMKVYIGQGQNRS